MQTIETIHIDTGIKEYSLNGVVSIFFNPTDLEFIEAVVSAFDRLDEMQQDYQKRIDAANKDGGELFDITKQMDADIRAVLNEVFGEDVCTPLVGKTRIYAVADGLPIWANMLFAIMDLFDSAIVEEKKRTNPRIKKYTEKYSRRGK